MAKVNEARDGDSGHCRKCGKCCSGLIVEAYIDDLRREPRLLDASLGSYRPDPDDAGWRNRVKCLILAVPGMPCEFLTADNLCSIYATRPDVCRNFVSHPDNCSRCSTTKLG